MDKPYTSLFSDLPIDTANRLSELVCLKYAQKNGISSLPQNFWRLDAYKTIYIREVSQARILLRTYDERAIVAALNRWEARYITSLRNRNLLPLIKTESAKLKDTEFVQESVSETSHPKPFGKNKLGDL